MSNQKIEDDDTASNETDELSEHLREVRAWAAVTGQQALLLARQTVGVLGRAAQRALAQAEAKADTALADVVSEGGGRLVELVERFFDGTVGVSDDEPSSAEDNVRELRPHKRGAPISGKEE